jgi:hypothetical protein
MIHWKWSEMEKCQLSILLWTLARCRCLGMLHVELYQDPDVGDGVSLWNISLFETPDAGANTRRFYWIIFLCCSQSKHIYLACDMQLLYHNASIYYFHIAIGHGGVKDNNCISEGSHAILYLLWRWWPICISMANGRSTSVPVYQMELLYLVYTSRPIISELRSKLYSVWIHMTW